MDITVYSQILPQRSVIMWFGEKDSVPAGWALCNGDKVQNSNGEEFQTPNLINRFVVGAGDIYKLQDTGGADTVTLSIEQIPAHGHTGITNQGEGAHAHFNQTTARADNDDNDCPNNFITSPEVDYYKSYQNISSEGSQHQHGFTTNPTGGSMEHENRPPYFALYYIIKID